MFMASTWHNFNICVSADCWTAAALPHSVCGSRHPGLNSPFFFFFCDVCSRCWLMKQFCPVCWCSDALHPQTHAFFNFLWKPAEERRWKLSELWYCCCVWINSGLQSILWLGLTQRQVLLLYVSWLRMCPRLKGELGRGSRRGGLFDAV